MADEAYFQQHGVVEKLEEVINQMVSEKPADPFDYIAKKLGTSVADVLCLSLIHI